MTYLSSQQPSRLQLALQKAMFEVKGIQEILSMKATSKGAASQQPSTQPQLCQSSDSLLVATASKGEPTSRVADMRSSDVTRLLPSIKVFNASPRSSEDDIVQARDVDARCCPAPAPKDHISADDVFSKFSNQLFLTDADAEDTTTAAVEQLRPEPSRGNLLPVNSSHSCSLEGGQDALAGTHTPESRMHGILQQQYSAAYRQEENFTCSTPASLRDDDLSATYDDCLPLPSCSPAAYSSSAGKRDRQQPDAVVTSDVSSSSSKDQGRKPKQSSPVQVFGKAPRAAASAQPHSATSAQAAAAGGAFGPPSLSRRDSLDSNTTASTRRLQAARGSQPSAASTGGRQASGCMSAASGRAKPAALVAGGSKGYSGGSGSKTKHFGFPAMGTRSASLPSPI